MLSTYGKSKFPFRKLNIKGKVQKREGERLFRVMNSESRHDRF